MSLASTLSIRAVSDLVGSFDLANTENKLDYSKAIELATGTGAGQADLIFHDQRTLAASANEDLDLAGSLTDPLGNTLTFARIKAVIVAAASGNTNNVQVSRPASNGVPLFAAASDAILVRPGGFFAWAALDATGVAVTGGTGDLLNIANDGAGTPVTYDIIIIGASA